MDGERGLFTKDKNAVQNQMQTLDLRRFELGHFNTAYKLFQLKAATKPQNVTV